MEEPTPEQIEEFREAERQRITAAVASIDESISTVEGQISIADAAGDAKSSERLHRSLNTLNRRKQEIESGERQT